MKVEMLLVLVLAGTLIAPRLSAQALERDDVHLRNGCRLAARVILTGHPEPHEGWALEGC
jgi:hypothetical protein